VMLVVTKGHPLDITRLPQEYDGIFDYLASVGLRLPGTESSGVTSANDLHMMSVKIAGRMD
jgi:hypothetical protein